ncbi:MAG: CooT family nickel-binding protein [Candidatus Geothermarchaeales archaeon]
MCEFTVFRGAKDAEEKVAEDIIRVKMGDGDLFLYDVLGRLTRVENSLIEELSVDKERMRIAKMPILSPLLRFAQIYERCLAEGRFLEEIEAALEDVKRRGDEVIRSLRLKYTR